MIFWKENKLSTEMDRNLIYYPGHYSPIKLNQHARGYFDIESFYIDPYNSCVKIKDYNERVIDYDYLIFSAGGLNTPKLLAEQLNIPVDYSFLDHPMGFFRKVACKECF